MKVIGIEDCGRCLFLKLFDRSREYGCTKTGKIINIFNVIHNDCPLKDAPQSINVATNENLCKICGQGPEADHGGCFIIAMQRLNGRQVKMETELSEKYETDCEHVEFLEKLLETLYGEGWEKLTLSGAAEWHKNHIAGPTGVADGEKCPNCAGKIVEQRYRHCPRCGHSELL